MTLSILELARPAIRSLKAYSSARSLTTDGKVFLDANENPWGTYNRYPEPQPEKLRQTLSEYYGVKSDSLFLGRGSDDAIDTLVRTFCEAGRDSILICPPTYGVYEVAANIQGANVVRVPTNVENDFAVNPEEVISASASNVKLIFLCSPNNPTGNSIPHSTIIRIADSLKDRAILVIDEAYIEFSDEPSFTGRLHEFPNVLVLRTLSKAWALAGARCGVAIGHPEIIALLQKVRAPYPLSLPSVEAVLRAFDPIERKKVKDATSFLLEERKKLMDSLTKFSFIERVFETEANFILIKVRKAADVLGAARTHGIVLRDRSRDHGLNDCVRITVGSPEENRVLLAALSEVSVDA